MPTSPCSTLSSTLKGKRSLDIMTMQRAPQLIQTEVQGLWLFPWWALLLLVTGVAVQSENYLCQWSQLHIQDGKKKKKKKAACLVRKETPTKIRMEKEDEDEDETGPSREWEEEEAELSKGGSSNLTVWVNYKIFKQPPAVIQVSTQTCGCCDTVIMGSANSGSWDCFLQKEVLTKQLEMEHKPLPNEGDSCRTSKKNILWRKVWYVTQASGTPWKVYSVPKGISCSGSDT